MIWTIAKKEFLSNLMTFKFAVCTAICLIMVVLFTWVLVDDYQRRLEAYNEAVQKSEEELKEARVYSEISPTVYKPPEVLSIFSEGVEKRLGNSVTIERGKVPEIKAGYAAGNPLLAVFPSLDLTLIFKLVLSILALLLVYDAISGEKERGSLKLMLSGPVPRHQVLLGKLVAGLLTLAIPIAVSFLLVLLILEFSPMVSLSGSDWARIGLIFLASLIFVGAVFNFGLFFSCLTERSATTLMYVLFFWVLFAVVIPNAAVYLATQIRPIKPREAVDLKVREIWDEFYRKRENFERENRPRVPKIAMGSIILNAPEGMIEYYRTMYNVFEPIRIKYATKAWELEQEYFNNLKKQKRVADYLSRISPTSMYEAVMSALSKTDLGSYERFMEETRTYRDRMIDYFNSRKLFSSLSFFTVQKEEDLLDDNLANEIYMAHFSEELKKRGIDVPLYRTMDEILKDIPLNKRIPAQQFLKALGTPHAELYNRSPALNLRDFPRFSYRTESVADSVQRTVPYLALLLLVNVLFFLLAFRAFLRYDAG